MKISRGITLMVLLSGSLASVGQDAVGGLDLAEGTVYRISHDLSQNTQSEGGSNRGSASLNISSVLDLTVTGTDSNGSYSVRCRYNDLELSLFAPSLNVAISSESSSGKGLREYFTKLEEHVFNATLTQMGELRNPTGLNAFIDSLYLTAESDREAGEVLLKTLREAFGEEALVSMFNVSMHIHGVSADNQVKKRVTYHFNTHPLEMQNTFYFQPPAEGSMRVQGIGVFGEQTYQLELGKREVNSTYSGNQTFDLLFDAESGWIIEGASRQRVFIITEFHGYEEYPEGLKIPSSTESEFIFSGEIIEQTGDDQKRARKDEKETRR